jgi:DNA-binding NarL/FixJ family response regulator
MLTALSQLMLGEIYYCSQTKRLLSPSAAGHKLPDKYRQLLWCMRQGYAAKDMAMATALKVSTVNGYVKHIYALIGSRSMIALESFMKTEGML